MSIRQLHLCEIWNRTLQKLVFLITPSFILSAGGTTIFDPDDEDLASYMSGSGSGASDTKDTNIDTSQNSTIDVVIDNNRMCLKLWTFYLNIEYKKYL